MRNSFLFSTQHDRFGKYLTLSSVTTSHPSFSWKNQRSLKTFAQWLKHSHLCSNLQLIDAFNLPRKILSTIWTSIYKMLKKDLKINTWKFLRLPVKLLSLGQHLFNFGDGQRRIQTLKYKSDIWTYKASATYFSSWIVLQLKQ